MIHAVVRSHRDAIRDLAARHGASNIRVFGSAARSESSPRDVDLLVDLEEGRSLLDLIAIEQDLEDLLHRSVDVVTERGLSPYLRARVMSEAQPL